MEQNALNIEYRLFGVPVPAQIYIKNRKNQYVSSLTSLILYMTTYGLCACETLL